LILMLSLMIILAGCSKQVKRVNQTKEEVKKSPVSILTAKRKDFKVKLPVTGTIEGIKEIKVFAESNGRLVNLRIGEGSQVKKGEIIGSLEKDNLKVNLKQARANLEMNQANLAKIKAGARPQEIKQVQAVLHQAQASYNKLKLDYDRIKSLYEKGTTTKARLDAVKANYEVAKAKLESAKENLSLIKAGARKEDILAAKAKVKQAKAKLESSKLQLNDANITASISGVITDLFVEEGEIVKPNASLAYLVKMGQVLLEADISTKDLAKVKKGQMVEVKVVSYPQNIFKGEITRIGDKVNQRSRTVQVKIEIDNSGLKLKSGMFAEGKIIIDTFEDAIVLSERVVEQSANQDIIYVIKDGRVIKRKVTGELITINKYLVKSGLTQGERVIMTNLNELQDGSQVYVRKQGSGQ